MMLGPAACRSASEPPTKTNGGTVDTCGAVALQDLVGKDGKTLSAVVQRKGTRIFTHGAALTMDFIPDRLNVELDGSGTILRIFCG